MILLRADFKIKTVFQKMINTMGENVKWLDIFVINNNDIILAGEGRSLFFNFENRRTFSNIVDLPINEDKVRLMTQGELLENTINMILYAFGKWGGIKGLTVEMNYDQLNKLINTILEEIDIEASLTSENFRFYRDGVQLTYEEVIQLILDLSKPKEEESEDTASEENNEDSNDDEDTENQSEEKTPHSLGLWHNMRWTSGNFTIQKEEITDHDRIKRLGHNFYPVNYKCPTCEEKLHMVVYPEGNEFRIETDHEAVYMARAYTCSACNSFHTPKPHKLLAEGDVYYFSFEDDKVAYEDYLELLGRDGERTANSNFNEYESEYIWKNQEEPKDLEEICTDIESMTEEEIVELREKMDSGFYPETSVETFTMKVDKEISSRKQKIILEKDNASKEVEKLTKSNKNEDSKNSDKDREKENKKENKYENGNENKKENTIKGQKANKKDTSKKLIKISAKRRNNNTSKNSGLITMPKLQTKKIKLDSNKVKQWQQSKNEEYRTSSRTNQTGRNEKQIELEPKNATQRGGDSVSQVPEFGANMLNELKSLLNLYVAGEIERFDEEIGRLTFEQLGDFKVIVHRDVRLDDSNKKSILEKINQILFHEKEKEWTQKITKGSQSSYSEILKTIQEIKRDDCDSDVKEPFIDSLKEILKKRGKLELEQIVMHIPENISKKQYNQIKEKIKQYLEIDTSSYEAMLNEKRDAIEKQEIASFILRANAVDRQSMYDLYNQLKGMDFEKRNVESYLDTIFDKIFALDDAAIKRICPDPADITFEDGLWMYEEIEAGNYLPELKVNVLGLIDQRLRKLKMDESEQLVRKFSKNIEWTKEKYPRVYFYDARKMMKGDIEDEESIVILNALNSYASEIGKYEYPILICDASHSSNGKGGFVLTPDHIFYNTLLNSGVMKVIDIESVILGSGLINKGIYVNHISQGKVKLCNTLKGMELKPFQEALNEFVAYLQEKPESRSIAYLAKENHTVKCCLRCGYVYKGGSECPKCGAKINK